MRRWTVRAAWVATVVVLVASMADLGLLDPARVWHGLRNTALFAAGLFPPDFTPIGVLAEAMVETLQIAFVGTALGCAMALPAGLLATRTLVPAAVTAPLHLALAAVRTVPSLVWGLVFVVAFGLGPAAGTLGIAVYTLGYLGKLFHETFEGVDREVIEAVTSVGCNRAQLMRFVLLPESANVILSQVLFVFEYNVRASAIMGFVGAGGIGFYMIGYVQLLQYRNLMTALLLTLAVVLAIDRLSAVLRRLALPAATP